MRDQRGGSAKKTVVEMGRTGLLRGMAGMITTLLGKMSSRNKRLSVMSCGFRGGRDGRERLTPQCTTMTRR